MALTTRLSTSPRCPECGTLLDAATAGPQRPEAHPKDGDVTVCIRCVTALIFQGHGRSLTLRLPTPDEADELRRDRVLASMKARVITLSRHPVNGWELK